MNGKTDNQTAQVPSALLIPINVDTKNIQSTVVKDKFVNVADLCAGSLAAACTAAGVS